MDPPFSEGEQPPSYTNQQLATGADQQSSCMPGVSSTNSYYTPSPVAQELSPHPSESGSLPPASTLYQHHQPPRSTQSPGAFVSMTSNPQHVPRSHNIWPSPPLGSDELDNFSADSSPTCGSSQAGYNASPVSPKTWPSPQYPYQHTSEPFSHIYQQDPLKLHLCPPVPAGSLPLRSTPASTTAFGRALHTTDGLPRDVSLHDLTNGPFSGTQSPVDLQEAASGYLPVAIKGEAPPTGGAANATSSGSRQVNNHGPASKGEEPYAQLIYRAFMSRPNYSMTLQEIYQWFRENTDKAKSESKGWQNSIRHNLSMNLAFTKRKPRSPSVTIVGDQMMPSMHDPKKSTEWVLADWAVRNGVQSTTRYRKGNPTRSRAQGKMANNDFHYGFQHGGNRVSTKATSGRKGGCAASRARLRSRHFNQTSHMANAALVQHGGLPMPMVGPPIRPVMLPTMFTPHYGEQQMFLPRVQTMGTPQMGLKTDAGYSPLTPETTGPDSSFGLMLPGPSLASHQGTSAGVHDATYSLVNGDQGSVYGHYPYGASDVTGVFHHGQTAAPHSGSSQLPLAAGGNGHPFGTIANESCDWNDTTAV